jgi:transcriptional regulator with XRE-family HTH domain
VKKFGKAVQKIRVDADRTLREVAEALDVKVSFLSDVEHGRKRPFNPPLLNKFVEYFKCDSKPLEKLAALERSSIEIQLDTKNPLVTQLAYALARGDISHEIAKEMLGLLEEGES